MEALCKTFDIEDRIMRRLNARDPSGVWREEEGIPQNGGVVRSTGSWGLSWNRGSPKMAEFPLVSVQPNPKKGTLSKYLHGAP